jgi:hypothetical protein
MKKAAKAAFFVITDIRQFVSKCLMFTSMRHSDVVSDVKDEAVAG